MMYDGGGYGGHWGWMLASMVVTMMFLAGFVWIIARLIIDGNKRDARPITPLEPDALTVLQRRYASGELHDAEFDHRRRVLLGPS